MLRYIGNNPALRVGYLVELFVRKKDGTFMSGKYNGIYLLTCQELLDRTLFETILWKCVRLIA